MKNKFFFSLFMIVLLTSLLTSCSKDSQLASANEIIQSSATSKPAFTPVKPGVVFGRIDPAGIKASILLYDQVDPSKVFGPYYPDSGSGMFRIFGLPDGDYKLVISYYPITSTADVPATFSIAVTVQSNTVIDLGTIYL
jgi:hypothetical protein